MALKEITNHNEHYWKDENGRRHGEYKSWHTNGQLSAYFFYLNGNMHGECKCWHKNGQLNEHCYFMNGELHGECKQWVDNGKLWGHWIYVHGELLDIKPSTLTDKDKLVLTLRHNIQWL